MTKNLVVKKIQGVSNLHQPKNLKPKEECKENSASLLVEFFKPAKSNFSEGLWKMPYTIFVPTNLLKEISQNFKVS
jgi:hypothetical protein